ncbi:hypothetical protein RWB19_003025 [Listeria monocytogenes]|nr:hypothetical protein [Listeria monocytogenes]
MELYAIVDEDLQVAKHRSKGTLAVFKDLEMLKKHAWRYKESGKSYKIAEYVAFLKGLSEVME